MWLRKILLLSTMYLLAIERSYTILRQLDLCMQRPSTSLILFILTYLKQSSYLFTFSKNF